MNKYLQNIKIDPTQFKVLEEFRAWAEEMQLEIEDINETWTELKGRQP